MLFTSPKLFSKQLCILLNPVTLPFPVLESGNHKNPEEYYYLPDFVTREQVDSGVLCHLDVSDMNIDIWKQLIYHKNKWMSKSLKAFIEYIKSNEFYS